MGASLPADENAAEALVFLKSLGLRQVAAPDNAVATSTAPGLRGGLMNATAGLRDLQFCAVRPNVRCEVSEGSVV
jgi:hypothetical protein